MSCPQGFLRILPVLIFIMGIGLLTTRCTSFPSTTRFLVDQPDRAVGMEVTYREGSPEYSHPAALTPELLGKILQHIEVQPSSLLDRIAGGSSTNQVAFSEGQRSFLADHLSRALKEATPLETVTFYWATPRGNGIWELTSGGLYLQENDLHIVLPNYRQTLPAKNPPEFSKKQPLLPIGEALHTLSATNPARQLTQSLAIELWSPQTPHFVFALSELANVHLPSDNQQGPPSTPTFNSSDSVKQRLQRLEELWEENLLTEKEYQGKRQKILEEL